MCVTLHSFSMNFVLFSSLLFHLINNTCSSLRYHIIVYLLLITVTNKFYLIAVNGMYLSSWEKVKVEVSWKFVAVCTSALFLENFQICSFVLCYLITTRRFYAVYGRLFAILKPKNLRLIVMADTTDQDTEGRGRRQK